MTIIITILIVVCTVVVIIEEWFITSQPLVISTDWGNYLNFLGLTGLFGGIFGLLTKYRQHQLYCRSLARFRDKRNDSSRDSSEHTLIEMNHTH
jgi:hypothetical protein